MTNRRPVSARALVRALEKAGFQVHRSSASHLVLKRNGRKPMLIVVPAAQRIPSSTLSYILKQVRLSEDRLQELLS